MAFYNVENLFHPDQDSLNPDQEFSPQGSKKWESYKYLLRLKRLSKVIISLSDTNFTPPIIIGLAEIECKQVLEDLFDRTALRKWNYQFVHYDSPDRRGIDVALLYDKSRLKLQNSLPISYRCASDPQYQSRDMLYAEFDDRNNQFYRFVICHWPSRYGGKEASAFKRICASQLLRNFIDSLWSQSNDPLIIMGDFNDEPNDSSLSLLCKTGPNGLSLISPMEFLPGNYGSHRYQGEWTYLDQFIVDAQHESHLLKVQVHSPDFLLEPESQYPGFKPFRAFKGSFLTKGFSDHLPIVLDWSP